jgi:hypothetical protein
MSSLLELDRLLPVCRDPVIGDAVISKCSEMLQDDRIAPGDRLLKLTDAFRLADNALRVRLIPCIESVGSHIPKDAIVPDILIARLVMIWECDDPYGRALACLLYKALHIFIPHSVEIWYRLRQSLLSEYAIEWRSAKVALASFDPGDDVPLKLRELVADAIAFGKNS